jgi:hypothetical protein
VELATQAVILNVRSPATTTQPWLPLKKLTLEGQLDKSTGAAVGAPLILTLTLHAEGAGGEQLPSFATLLDNHQDFKVYPEPPETETDIAAHRLDLVGTRRETYTLIPQHNGQLVLPAINIAWWDVQADQQRWARWPEQTVWVGVAPEGAKGGKHERDEVSLGQWLAMGGFVLFLVGWWIGAGRPGITPALRLSKTALAGLAALLHRVGRQLQPIVDKVLPAPVRKWIIAWGHPVRSFEVWFAHVPLFKPLRTKQAIRQIDAANTPADLRRVLQEFAHRRLGMAPNAPLFDVAAQMTRSSTRVDVAILHRLIWDLEGAVYGGSPLTMNQWKRELKRQLWALELGRRPQEKNRQKGLPPLNPVARHLIEWRSTAAYPR